jgi:choline dehydrogenase
MQDAPDAVDYVIVGAGSAGCVLAGRLSEDAGTSVAILEAGPRDDSLVVKMPAGAGQLMPFKGPFNWGFETAPQQHLHGRKLFWPRGRGLGGSSNINAMLYVRGHARDYDQWRQMGLPGWSYRDVLPYFKRAENFEDGADAWHGASGPLHVSRPRSNNPLFKAFIQAGVAAGYPATRDFNGFAQEGFGPIYATMRDGERCSASRAYLHPALKRPNLAVVTNARATRILLENGRAVGVEYAARRGAPRRVIRARREIILAAGAVQSPHILHLSGIGDPDHLRAQGIAVAVSSPDVGRNLQDHLDLAIVHKCTKPITAYTYVRGMGQLRVGLAYMMSKSGPGRFNFLESGGFVKSRPELDVPDIQLQFVAGIVVDHARTKFDFDGFTLHACQVRPESRGFVGAGSADPFDDPLIDPNYLATELDRATMRACVTISRDILGRQPLAPFRDEEIFPGPQVRSDNEIDDFVRAKAETIYHPVGSCRMGADPKSVVDAELRVRGVAGLRVVDASVMPTLIGGNTNAPTIMIAEKAADLIRGRAALPAEDAPIAEDAAQFETTSRREAARLASGA